MTSSASGSPPSSAPEWILALDASTRRTAIALGRVDKERRQAELVTSFEADDGANQASHWLVDRIHAIVADAGIGLGDIGGIACGCGPGTFTGTRVAIASAQGLAFGLGCVCYPLSTLAALAGSGEPGETVLALLDARRSEVYAGLYELFDEDGLTLLKALGDDECCALEHALRNDRSPTRAVGPGVLPYRDKLPNDALPLPGVSGRGLWRAAVTAVLGSASVHPRALEANYLRRSYAELGDSRPKRPMIRSPFVE